MSVTTIGQGPGSVATLPGPQTGGGSPLLSLRGSPPTAAEVQPTQLGSDQEAAFARVAWFDVNGDGHIDNRSPNAGGDGTLLVPKHAAKVQTYSREVRRQEMRFGTGTHEQVRVEAKASTDVHTTTSGGEPTAAVSPHSGSSDVQTRQAIDAYQRYGQPQDIAPTERAVA
jgi:hypothetical protein